MSTPLYQPPHGVRRTWLVALLLLIASLGMLLYQPSAAANTLLQQQAEAGDAESQYQMGRFYVQRNDWAQAVPWYQRAAAQGHAKAQNNLGVAYMEGRGIPANPQEGCRLLEAAAEKIPGAHAANNVALCNDHPAVNNLPKAFAAYKEAAQLGNVQSQHNLAICYQKGDGTAVNLPLAVYWFRQAAIQEDAQAMYGLALMYARDEGVPHHSHNQAAAYLLIKAAEGKQTPDDAKSFRKVRFEKNLETMEKSLPPDAQAFRIWVKRQIKQKPMRDIMAEIDRKIPYHPPEQMDSDMGQHEKQ